MNYHGKKATHIIVLIQYTHFTMECVHFENPSQFQKMWIAPNSIEMQMEIIYVVELLICLSNCDRRITLINPKGDVHNFINVTIFPPFT